MAGRIPRDFIDDLLARTDIVDVVDNRVKLKKAGRNYQACCPFHNEKTPSFTVAQDKQFYHCFGCGAHGNAISFIMEFDRLEFPEAIEELARHHGLEVPREKGARPGPTPQQKQQQSDDYALMEQASKFFQSQLKAHKDGPRAIEYLKGRELSGEVVKHWQIGFAPPEWDSIMGTFGKTPQAQQQLVDLKLATQNDNGRRYDFFRDRIMFPIRDKRGRVIGFGGRVLGDGTPKYLNSPETRIFHKGNELYGFYQVKQAHRSLDKVMIVEGYMDVVALSQFGIDYAVASLGTATTPEHIQMLFRACPEIICCYDGDRAGRQAAWRALETALPHLKDGVQMKFLFLPDGEDPDTLVRKIGKEAFEAKLAEATPLSRFFFDNLLQNHQVNSAEGKAALKHEAAPLIAQILGDNQRQLLEAELSKHMGDYDRYQLQRDTEQANANKGMKAQDFQTPAKTHTSPVRMMIRLLLNEPKLASECAEVDLSLIGGLSLPGLPLLEDIHQYCSANPTANTALLLENFRDHPNLAHLSKLLTAEHLVKAENAAKYFRDSFATLLDWYFKGRIDELLSKSRVSTLTNEERQELNLLMKEQR